MTAPSNRPEITVDHLRAQVASEDAVARAHSYGVRTASPLLAETVAAREAIDYSKPPTPLADRNLVKVTIIRLVGFEDYDFPYVDLSYCYGELRDGTPVRVDLGRHQFAKAAWKSQLIQCFKDANRYAKGMGVDVNSVYSVSRG